MEWVASLRGKTVGLDTAPIIYFIEGNPLYVEMMRPFFLAVQKDEFSVVTSTVTLLETLVVPLRHGNINLAQQYRDILFKTKGHITISLFPSIAEEAARLRASHNISTPDSIQMATAISAGASFFLTNDTRLPSLPNLKTLVLEDLKKGSEG
jgi:predicted nucleic acid-binding protein